MTEENTNATGGAADPNNPYGYPMEDMEEGKILAILSYIIPIIFIVPLVQKDNHFSLFHAKQVILLVIAYVAASIVGSITCGIGFVLFIPIFVFNIMGLVYAIQGQYKPMPLIGQYAEDWFKGLKVAK